MIIPDQKEDLKLRGIRRPGWTLGTRHLMALAGPEGAVTSDSQISESLLQVLLRRGPFAAVGAGRR
eukprot:1021658-Heterocapsa_arctica.AAC.1